MKLKLQKKIFLVGLLVLIFFNSLFCSPHIDYNKYDTTTYNRKNQTKFKFYMNVEEKGKVYTVKLVNHSKTINTKNFIIEPKDISIRVIKFYLDEDKAIIDLEIVRSNLSDDKKKVTIKEKVNLGSFKDSFEDSFPEYIYEVDLNSKNNNNKLKSIGKKTKSNNKFLNSMK